MTSAFAKVILIFGYTNPPILKIGDAFYLAVVTAALT